MKSAILKSLKFLKVDEKEIESLLETPKSQEMGDYALPCFSLAKRLKKSPVVIAKEIASQVRGNFEKVEAVNGYVNFFFDRKKFAEQTLADAEKLGEKYGARKKGVKVLVEYSQPNTHKAFHIGHVRGTSLGESISRIIEFQGGKAIRINYSGDTGMHIAKWIWCYTKYHKGKMKDDEKWFASIYVDSVRRLEKNPALQEEVDEINRKLDSGKDKKLNMIWKETRKLSINSWKKIYKDLDTGFDVHYFESEVEKEGRKAAEKLVKLGVAKISEGAVIVNFKDHGKENLGVLVLLRKDGTVLYGAKDIALAERKFSDYKPDKSIYIVGKAQDLHIHQVFEILRLMKFRGADKSAYIPVNEVRFPWGKMSSRSGENVFYSDFRENLLKEIKKEIGKRDNATKADERALKIAISVIKYSMLKQDINKNIIFNPKEEIKFEGNTGPYLLYSYARAQSLLKKAGYKRNKENIAEINDYEKKLLRLIASFPDIAKEAYMNLAPSVIANYSYDLAKAFSEFYQNCPVIGNENENFRLRLTDNFSRVLKNSLNLLGIDVVKEM